MQITLNGKPYILEQETNILQLSSLLELESSRVAIERNREIVPRSQYAVVALQAGDEVEIVSFIGGG